MIKLEQVYASDYIEVATNQEKSFMEVTWLQQHPSVIFRRELKTVIDYMVTHQLNRVLYDIRERPYLELSDQNWVLKEIIPFYEGLNMRLAYVIGPISLTSMDVYRVQDAILAHPKLKKQLLVETFLTKEEAQLWLLK